MSRRSAVSHTRLSEVGIAPSVGSAGDSYDNAMAESIIGLSKTEVIRRRGPWKSIDAVEIATLDWAGLNLRLLYARATGVDWFNNRRILEPIGYRTPREAEIEDYQQRMGTAEPAGLTHRGGLAEGEHAHLQPAR